MTDGAGGVPTPADRRRRVFGIAAAAALTLLAVVLAFAGGGSDQAPVGAAPQLVSAADLRDLEADLDHTVYWAGERPPVAIELRTELGNVFLRYLPPGVAAGDERASFLTVGTYPVADAAAATRRFASEAGARVLAGDDGAVIVPNPDSAGSVYLAYPGSELQVEVYDARPGRALALIRAGAIVPVGEG